MEQKGLIRSASEAGLGTLISRLLGFARDVVIAAKFGAGAWADAFYVAFRIPNMLRNLLGEGAMGSSFIPVFSEYMARDEKEAWEIAKITLSILLIVVSSLTLLGIAIAPLIVSILAPGFAYNPEKFALTVSLTRLMYPFFLFILLAAFATSLLNGLRRFFVPAIAPAMLSIGELAGVFFIVPMMGGSIKGLSVGVLIGGAGQLLAQVPQALKFWPKVTGYFRLALTPGVKKIFKLMLPAAIGASIYQAGTLVDTICASYLIQGTPTALYYSNRLVQLPLAIFGTSIATASLPRMSECAARNDREGILNILSSGFRMIFFLLIPAAVGFMILGKPIIAALFQRGSFGPHAVDLTYSALFFFSLGLVSYAGVKVVASAFYALQDMKTPVIISTLAILLNIELNFILMKPMEIGGLALSTAIASTLNMSLLMFILRRKLGSLHGSEMMGSFRKMCLISAVIGIECLIVLALNVNPYFKTGIGILVSVLTLFCMAPALKISESGQVLRVILGGRDEKPEA